MVELCQVGPNPIFGVFTIFSHDVVLGPVPGPGLGTRRKVVEKRRLFGKGRDL